MRMYDIIKKKRDGSELTSEEIEFFVNGYVRGTIPDYQVSALLMAIFFRGMNQRETFDLTMSMARSGEILDLSPIEGIKVDKHSTGGVGDKTTLVVLPIIAAFGVKVPKMSGRGLGHTGGTIDKLESIPGMRTELTRGEFFQVVKKVGFSIVSQSGNLVPADKKIYALRDTTATVDSIPLIASSIVSKKLAGGADAIIFDVKVGSGAFLKDTEQAQELACLMIDILKRSGKLSRAVLSDMNQPLGRMVGNSLEVIEAVETLKGNGPEDLTKLCIRLCHEILNLVGMNVTEEQIKDEIVSGRAVERFAEFIEMQGGDPRIIDDYRLLPVSRKVVEVRSVRPGYVDRIDTEAIGIASVVLGAGRSRKEDSIDPSVGIEVLKKIGDYVHEDEPIVRIYVSEKSDVDLAISLIHNAYGIVDHKVGFREIVLGVIE
ncbi:MAG TPA: pyrimidine-nucleoside phosphorylase [Pseudothermotoga sp.]|nr:pyrimidine-nucleoside phosphorylase [Pseudothermotoga sp.]HPP70402.1 pyrimidine-nucleoside phosphorylase [Pseudothermotoga sp.]